MAETIPYDPTILLGHIIPPEKLDKLKKISVLQNDISNSREELESAMVTRRSLSLTKFELVNLGVKVENLNDVEKESLLTIEKAASKYGEVILKNMSAITKLKKGISLVEAHVESPIDYNRSILKSNLPLASDSMKLNGQYFNFTGEDQSASNAISAMKKFVSSEINYFGDSHSSKVSDAVQKQVSQQREHHGIDGTLILTATCTHSKASIFSPCVIDVDKAIRAWNFVNKEDTIKMDISNVVKIANEEGTEKENSMNIVSGATYGSCFIGMVHILKHKETTSSQDMSSVTRDLQTQFEVGGWFADYSGGFGVNSSFSSDIKALLSQQQISSHISIICEGCIPTITSNAVSIGVEKFANFDASQMMEKLAVIHNATTGDNASMHSAAQAARDGKKMVEIRGAEVNNVMSSLGELKEKDDKVMDINSLMASFEDYIKRASTGDVGVPINFFIKPITKAQLAQMWIAKYYPDRFVNISGVDSATDTSKELE